MANDLSVKGSVRSSSSASTDQPQMSPFQQASVAAAQKALSSGASNDPKLQQDLQAVRNAKTPEALHAAVHQLRKDAKADGIEMPKGGGGAGKAKGGGGASELDPDSDLYAPGDGLKAAQKQDAGPQFGFNGSASMFTDGFDKKS